MTRPKLLDLFCGAGGCSVGYDRAGFDVIGVDKDPHPDYPYPFTQADALDVLADLAYLEQFDVVHTSPPCPRYSVATSATKTRDKHPDLVPPVRELLKTWGGHYVIENVPGAPLLNPVLICGWAMGLRHIKRHRLFETDLPLMSPGCLCPIGDTVSVFGNAGEDRRKSNTRSYKQYVPLTEARTLMGVEWMRRREDVSDSIPPAYTQYLGEQIIEQLVTT